MKTLTVTDGKATLEIIPHNDRSVWFNAEHAEWKVTNEQVYENIKAFFQEEPIITTDPIEHLIDPTHTNPP